MLYLDVSACFGMYFYGPKCICMCLYVCSVCMYMYVYIYIYVVYNAAICQQGLASSREADLREPLEMKIFRTPFKVLMHYENFCKFFLLHIIVEYVVNFKKIILIYLLA